jgi:hypothetical protein
MNIPDHIFESVETIFWVKKFKFFDADPDPRSGNFFILDPGSGMEKNSDPGSRINIPDPQHCYPYYADNIFIKSCKDNYELVPYRFSIRTG